MFVWICSGYSTSPTIATTWRYLVISLGTAMETHLGVTFLSLVKRWVMIH